LRRYDATMSTLKASLVIETPFAQAADLVERFFVSQTADDGVITLRLSAPGAGIGIDSFAVGHEVVATFRRRKGPYETIVFDLHWESADGGPFPVFDGTLTVAEDETYQTCRLILEGSYLPPGRLAGAVFDAALGSRIAYATAHELLERMETFLRVGYEATELSKRVSAARPEYAPESPAARPASE
jgi:hypothetical protein